MALFRIFLSLIILFDLVSRLPRFIEYYGEEGISPMAWLQEPTQAKLYDWSLFFLFPGTGWTVFLFFLLFACALMLLIGYHCRLNAIFLWLLVLSLQAKSPFLCFGADKLLAVLLFWAMWLPLGRHWSLDARRRETEIPLRISLVRSFASLGLTIQVALVYWMNAITKSNTVWRRDGTAVEHALKIDTFSTGFGEFLLHFPVLLKAGTCFTLYLEEIGPFLLFLPFFNGWLRTLAVGLFVFFHLGMLATTMHLGIFPYVGALAWIPFLPPSFWQWLLRKKHEPYTIVTQNPIATAACAFFCLVVILWNVRSVMPAGHPWFSWNTFNRIGKISRLKQKWNLFAPYPNTNDGWLIAAATTPDGRKIDLLNGGAALDFTRPEELASKFRGCRERGYELYLFHRPYPRQVDWFVRSITNRWYAAGGGEFRDLTLYHMDENNVLRPGIIRCHQLWPYDTVSADGKPVFKEVQQGDQTRENESKTWDFEPRKNGMNADR